MYFQKCIANPKIGRADEWECFRERLAFLDRFTKNHASGVQWASLWDLMNFCEKHPNMVGLYDLESEFNWGLAGRNGELCPIVIDAGIPD